MKLTKITILTLFVILLTACSEDETTHVAQAVQSNQEERIKELEQQLSRQAQIINQQDQVLQQPQVVQQVPVQQPVYAPQPQQPIVVQSAPAPQHDSTFTDMLLGGVIGHAIGSSGGSGSNYQPSRTVVNRTYVNKTYVNKTYPSRSSFKSSSSSRNRSRR